MTGATQNLKVLESVLQNTSSHPGHTGWLIAWFQMQSEMLGLRKKNMRKAYHRNYSDHLVLTKSSVKDSLFIEVTNFKTQHKIFPLFNRQGEVRTKI